MLRCRTHRSLSFEVNHHTNLVATAWRCREFDLVNQFADQPDTPATFILLCKRVLDPRCWRRLLLIELLAALIGHAHHQLIRPRGQHHQHTHVGIVLVAMLDRVCHGLGNRCPQRLDPIAAEAHPPSQRRRSIHCNFLVSKPAWKPQLDDPLDRLVITVRTGHAYVTTSYGPNVRARLLDTASVRNLS